MRYRAAALAVLGLVAMTALGASLAVAEVPPRRLLPSSTSHRYTVEPTLETIDFSTPNEGYGLFEEQGVRTCKGLVGKTGDGGASFDSLAVAMSWACSNNPPARFLTFDDGGDGFLYGPRLFVTHNRGKTWQPDTQPGVVVAVSAVGHSVWMLEGDCPAGAFTLPRSTTCPLRLLQSTDGGRAWSAMSDQPPGARASTGALTLEAALGQGWLTRVNGASAYVVSNPTPTESASSSNTASLWYTDDGGATWVAEEIPCGVDAQSVSFSVAPDGAVVAVCAEEPAAGSEPKSMSVSLDEGRTWSVRRSCVGSSSQCPSLLGYLGNVAATSSTTAFVVGDRSPLLITRDGGNSWEALQTVGDVNGMPAQVIFFGAANGVVLGRENTASSPIAIWHTADGGLRWTEFTPTIK